MSRRLVAVTLFAASLLSAAPQTQFPDTPAAHQFAAWLEAFNSGDRAKLLGFLQKNNPARAGLFFWRNPRSLARSPELNASSQAANWCAAGVSGNCVCGAALRSDAANKVTATSLRLILTLSGSC